MDDLTTENRIGTFRLGKRLLDSCSKEDLARIFEDMFIVKAEYDFATRSFQYTAYCDKFSRVAPCNYPYDYEAVLINKRSNTKISHFVEFERV